MSDQDLDDPVLADEWPTECSNPDWSDNCNGDLETARERMKGLCQGCLDVIASWSDDEDDNDDSVTEQTTLVTDGGIDKCSSDTEQSASYLKFGHENIDFILDGYEDATIRAGLEREFQAGDTVELRSPKDRVFGHAEAEEVYESRVGQAYFDTVFVDDRSHPAHSDEDLLDRLRRHYNNDVTFDTPVTVIYFHVTEIRMPRELHTGTSHDGGADDA